MITNGSLRSFVVLLCNHFNSIQLICFASDACQAKLLTLTNKDDDGTKKAMNHQRSEPFRMGKTCLNGNGHQSLWIKRSIKQIRQIYKCPFRAHSQIHILRLQSEYTDNDMVSNFFFLVSSTFADSYLLTIKLGFVFSFLFTFHVDCNQVIRDCDSENEQFTSGHISHSNTIVSMATLYVSLFLFMHEINLRNSNNSYFYNWNCSNGSAADNTAYFI